MNAYINQIRKTETGRNTPIDFLLLSWEELQWKYNFSDDPLIARADAAKLLNRKPRTLAWWDCMKKNDLQPIKIGTKDVLYRLSVLHKYLQNQMKPD